MEESQQQKANSQPSYWTSVGVAGLLFGIIVFALSIISAYATINSEPTGSLFSPVQLIGTLACLVGAFGGMLAIWHYTREFDVVVKLGKGALIGLLAGVAITIVNVLLSQIWTIVDPDMMDKMIESTLANLEAMDMPEQQKQQTIDMTVESMRSQKNIGTQLLWGLPMYGILNIITGMIGAKIFGADEE